MSHSNHSPKSDFSCVGATTLSDDGPHDWIHVSGGDGNLKGVSEVHIQMWSAGGHMVQAWFKVDDLIQALAQHETTPED